MWLINPRVLCDDHLLGSHSECHQLVGTIHNHPHGEAVAEGHAEKGNIDTFLLEQWHRLVVEEMEQRGWDHDSPLSYSRDEPQYGKGSIDPQENVEELRQRCDDCAILMEHYPAP